MEPENHIINALQTAKLRAYAVFDIVYQVKYIYGYVPSSEELQEFNELTATLKRIYEDTDYITRCMKLRRSGQNEYEYLLELAKKAYINKNT